MVQHASSLVPSSALAAADRPHLLNLAAAHQHRLPGLAGQHTSLSCLTARTVACVACEQHAGSCRLLAVHRFPHACCRRDVHGTSLQLRCRQVSDLDWSWACIVDLVAGAFFAAELALGFHTRCATGALLRPAGRGIVRLGLGKRLGRCSCCNVSPGAGILLL